MALALYSIKSATELYYNVPTAYWTTTGIDIHCNNKALNKPMKKEIT